MKKIKNLTYDEHLENALEKIFERCKKVYPKTHKIFKQITKLDTLQDLSSNEYCKATTSE